MIKKILLIIIMSNPNLFSSNTDNNDKKICVHTMSNPNDIKALRARCFMSIACILKCALYKLDKENQRLKEEKQLHLQVTWIANQKADLLQRKIALLQREIALEQKEQEYMRREIRRNYCLPSDDSRPNSNSSSNNENNPFYTLADRAEAAQYLSDTNAQAAQSLSETSKDK